MGWNEPNNKNSSNSNEPPDLDEVLKKFQSKFKNVFSGGNGAFITLIAIIAFILWFLSGIFIVKPAEKAAVLYFGKYEETVGAGPHWIPRFFASKILKMLIKLSRILIQDKCSLKMNTWSRCL